MQIVSRICREIDKKERPVAKSIRYFARLYRNRCYEGTEKPIRLARGTITGLYYKWLKLGRQDTALQLKFHDVGESTFDTVLRLAKASLTPQVDNFWIAYGLILNPRRSLGCSRDAMPVRLHREIDRLFRSRRAVWRCEVRVLRLIAELEASR